MLALLHVRAGGGAAASGVRRGLKLWVSASDGLRVAAARPQARGALAAAGAAHCHRRHMAGRSSGGGRRSGQDPAEETTASSSGSSGRSSLASASGEGAAAGEAASVESSAASGGGAASDAASSAASSSGGGAASTLKEPAGAPALFALPLYRKPAFPGFYQIVQVSDQEVLDFLVSLRKNGQGEYLGGFMTKELPSKVAAADAEVEVPLGNAQSTPSQSLRRDAGTVANVNELEEVGTVLQVISLAPYPNIAGGQVVVMPHRRIRRTRLVSAPSPHVSLAAVHVEYLTEPEVPKEDAEVKAMHLEIIATMKELMKTSFVYNEQFEQVIRFYDLDHPLKLADLVAGMSLAQRQDLQAILCEDDLMERLKKVLAIVKKDLEFAKLQSQVKSQVEEKVKKEQRRLMLMEQMKQITKELGIEKEDKQALVQTFRDAIKDKTVPEEANKVIEAELAKLGTLEPSSSEFNVCRTYLEWLTCLPWGQYSTENKTIAKAEAVLNEDHYGLEDVKERILEHIAVSFLKESVQGKIMCMVGPPGVGKTSIGQSIARALDRKFFRFSVGGLHDVAEIRGHRRTYVGAMPGKLIQCLKITQSSNPVVLIDEIDKLGRDARGDPSSALLEVLDPEQNSNFRDHYLDVPVDLSRVLFVCTANILDTIPGPLLDRMEVIRIAGYVFEEKMAIAKQYLIPQTKETSGIGPESLNLQEDALERIVNEYAREAGVRQLRKLLEKISRKVALQLVRTKEDEQVERKITTVTPDTLSQYIGQPIHVNDMLYKTGAPPGVVMGLAWTAMGGATLFVEARGEMPRGPKVDAATGTLKVTGKLGEVMNESSAISLTYARLFVRELDASNDFLDKARLHLNVPEGATPKDGPSAGVTMATSLVSLALDQPVREKLAMTGELTLMGKVLKVGGIKEKVIAARREGVEVLLLPRQNEADYVELKEYLRSGMTAHFVDHFDDVYQFAFETREVPRLGHEPRGLPVSTVVTPVTEAPSAAPPTLDATATPLPTAPASTPAPSPAA